jgi:hypothetical protein
MSWHVVVAGLTGRATGAFSATSGERADFCLLPFLSASMDSQELRGAFGRGLSELSIVSPEPKICLLVVLMVVWQGVGAFGPAGSMSFEEEFRAR